MTQTHKELLLKRISDFANDISTLIMSEKIEMINEARKILHAESPFRSEPVDCVLWVKSDTVFANSYNPNHVSKPELDLLKLSIEADGYTQPIVTMIEGKGRETIDGYHRGLIAKTCQPIKDRIYGYAPVVTINDDRHDINDRMAATIRHNRARGKHQISAMSDIVMDLKKRNWSDEKISKNLGMDADEVLRLCQIGGLTELFADKEFSQAWEAELYNDTENID